MNLIIQASAEQDMLSQVEWYAHAQLAKKAGISQGLAQAANAFAHTYWVAFALVGMTVAAAVFLPRKREEPHLVDHEESQATPVAVH